MISLKRRDKSLKFLHETDEQAAKAKSYLAGLEDQKKTILAIEFQRADGSQGEKLKIAESSQAYKDHLKKLEYAVYDYEVLRNRRSTEALIVECWRSENANRRVGNI